MIRQLYVSMLTGETWKDEELVQVATQKPLQPANLSSKLEGMKTAVVSYRVDGDAGQVTVLTGDGVSQFPYQSGLERLDTLQAVDTTLESRGLYREYRASRPAGQGGLEITLFYLPA